VFIRNYLTGRRWLRSAGLAAHVAPVAWLPDDFGHDPQLPLVLAAMGLQWAGLSRVPGSPQPYRNSPTNGTESVAAQLTNGGLVFPWIADDGSAVLTHYMPATYGAPWDGRSGSGGLQAFVEGNTRGWPTVDGAALMFAPAGGDFVFSRWDVDSPGSWLTVVSGYNNNTGRKATDPVADIGTFPQFMAMSAGSPGEPQAPLLAQNYWTGVFASRPRLKILHNRAAQRVMAAEAATALLRLASTYATATLDDLDAAIDQAWQALVPSSHHDYITGTSPDRVYASEQLPQLELADRLAGQCLTGAVGLIAAAATAGTVPDGNIPVVVFNPLGFARGGVVHVPARDVTGSFAAVSGGSPAQRAADGGLVFVMPAPVDSFGYATVTLTPGEPAAGPLPAPSDTVTMDNGLMTVSLDRDRGWAVTSLVIGGVELIPPGGLGNSIRLYNDTGNIYQFGNEPLSWDQPQDRGVPGTFDDSGTSLAGDAGEWIEAGPVRWHFRATLTGTFAGPVNSQPAPVAYTLDYLLDAGETVLRMRLTGAAPVSASVLTAFDLAPAVPAGYGLTYGTAHHYDAHLPTPYWAGPTFRATHDFVQATGSTGPELAIYHQAVPAWAPVQAGGSGQLLGALLRNNPCGQDRGAAGGDPGVHTLEYAAGRADSSPVPAGDALRTALTVTNPLIGAVPGASQPADGVSLPPQASLATITQPPAGILRVARTQPGGSVVDIPSLSGYYAERRSYTLRVYLPASFGDGVAISVPDLPDPGLSGYSPDLAAVAVTALEEPADGPQVTVSGTTVSFTSRQAVTTVQLTATRCPTLPGDGKP
jgi:alpha-mannosidase